MRQKSGLSKPPAVTVVKHIRRRARKQHSAEEKIPIVLEGCQSARNLDPGLECAPLERRPLVVNR